MKSDTLELEVVQLGVDGIAESNLLVHDETNHVMAVLLAGMHNPDFPVAIGVLYCEPAQSYDTAVREQITTAVAANADADMNSLLRSGATWTV